MGRGPIGGLWPRLAGTGLWSITSGAGSIAWRGRLWARAGGAAAGSISSRGFFVAVAIAAITLTAQSITATIPDSVGARKRSKQYYHIL